MNYGAFHSRSVARLASLVGVVAALGLAGCDGDDDDGNDDTMAGTMTPGTAGDDGGSESDSMDDDGMDDGADSSSGGDGMDDGMPALSHAADIQPIWDEYCVPMCHEPGGEWPTHDLSGNAYSVLVEMPSAQNTLMNYVTPGEPENSYTLHKMRGTQVMSGGSGLTMPKGLPMMDPAVVPEADIAMIDSWIAQGAPE